MVSNIKRPFLSQFVVLNTNLAPEKAYRTRFLESSMSAYLPRRDYTQHFIPPLLDIAGDSENKSMFRKYFVVKNKNPAPEKAIRTRVLNLNMFV